MKTRSKAAIAILLVAVILGAAYLFLQQPTAGVQDVGDWGEVSEERTEIITTLWVDNPNPLGISLDDSIRISYQLHLNGVNLAEGSKEGISVPPGNNSATLTTELRNQKLGEWWVAYVQNNETIPVRAEPQATIQTGPLTVSPPLSPYNRTLLTDSTPMKSALSQAASQAEGQYSEPIQIDQDRFRDRGAVPNEVTAGYEVRRGWATWGEVSQNTTVVYFHFLLYNPSETICMPAEPENIGVTVEMNGIEMFTAQGDDTSLQNVGRFTTDTEEECLVSRRRAVIAPQETKEAVYAVRMNNKKIDEWFISHIQRNEQTDIRAEFQLAFSYNGTMFRIPDESPVAYTCQMQTNIFVDNQAQQTTCGSLESAPGIATSQNATSRDAEESPEGPVPTAPTVTQPQPDISTPTVPSTPTSLPTLTGAPPTARIQATPTQGEAPLKVSLDARESTDQNDDIEEYLWRFKDGSPPARGKTVTHTFQTAGEYEVELVVIDSQGNRDRATVTITVESRI